MLRYILRRTVSAVVVLVLLIATLFILQRLSPADPIRTLVGNRASPATVEHARHALGYDRPLIVQFFSYLGDVLHLDFQSSLRTKNPVASDVGATLPATLELLAFSGLLAIIGGFVIGLLTLRGGKFAGFVRVLMLATAAVPSFLFALLLILLFYSQWDLLPATGQTSIADAPTGPTGFLIFDSVVHGQMGTVVDAIKHLILPSAALATAPAVAIGRSFSSSLVTTMKADYIKTARMKGLNDLRLMSGHVFRNCLNSALAMTGLQVGVMLASVTIVESVFAWPGVGQYLALSIGATDLPAIIAVALVIGAIFIVVNTLTDILQALADPRITLNS
jgi:peptide/nickel transport system permease protein